MVIVIHNGLARYILMEQSADFQVNIIPVIAKADTISRSELPQFKARVSVCVCCSVLKFSRI